MKSYNFYKWRIWSILALSFVMSLFHRGALGVISDDITRSLGLTASELSNIASVTFYAYAFMQIPAGLLLDYLGYRRISYYGAFITGVGAIILGSSLNIYFAYSGRLLVGLGTSVIFISVLKAQRVWFSEKEFTKASGRLSFIGNMGGIIATFPLAFLVKGIGWRSSLIFMGMLSIIIAILIYIYVKNNPKDYGYEPHGVISSGEKIKVWSSIKAVVKNSATWRNFFVLFTLVGCTTTLTGLWGVSYLTSVYGMTKAKAAFYIAFIVYGLVAGSVFVEKAEKIFKNNIILYPRIANVIIALCWGYILFICKGKPSLTVLTVLFFIMGFFAMSHILAFTDINNNCEAKNSGLASSLVNSGEFIGSSIISMLIGFFLDLSWNGQLKEGIRYYVPELYTKSFYIFFIISLLGVATSFIGRKKSNFNRVDRNKSVA
jgi:sugar phosphate permease